jgi:hypothetical protein
MCQALEQLSGPTPEDELARAQALVAQLWPLLAKVSEHIMHNTTFADDD